MLLDTGALSATTDRDDADHRRCLDLLETDPGSLVTTPLVITEAAHLIDR